ncbi:MAG: hypothetical protein M0006_13745 [Magnetospirillum sp.]|nr:hypothetical protein [Magnetospirillum sp.]
MEREAALRIIYSIVAAEKHLGDIDSVISEMPDSDERKQFIAGLGAIMYAINFSFVFKIVKEFPDLDPDKDKNFPTPVYKPRDDNPPIPASGQGTSS